MSQELIQFNQESAARLLTSHLNAHGIPAHYKWVASERHAVVLHDLVHVKRAVELTEAFIENPTSPQYQQDAWLVGEQARQPVDLGLGHLQPAKLLKTPFTALVGIVCVSVFVATMLGFFAGIQQWFFIQPLHAIAESNQWWRLISPDFIHFSALHLVFNLLWWLMLGSQIERRLGFSTLFIVFILSSVFSNVAQLWVSGANFGGLSGVVYALVGFVWWLGWLRPQWGINLPKPVIGFLLVWLVIGYADVLWISMANTAHTVGLFSGCIGAFIVAQLKPQQRVSEITPDKDI
ncbi:rhomboid family intramembrane serine protease GlpG [Alteromonas oceanisediminis]|uniref:rhomboid family intramembrane serine protease GlpG n=1 Tax=Alteromonas oceanisediminis TaxID=2836180 RepID=UPI001BDABF6D|nr:rhomboid family intramembrane serine protease GlpG [Alteromonas oceanisediminis]MBT0586763.1 rhomboid family intramembrane serine protease GlpG [Alteromonas oceanisediminis]